MFLRALIPNICTFVSKVAVFENEGVSDNTSEFVFQFLVRYVCIKRGKIKRLYACYLVERYKLSPLNS